MKTIQVTWDCDENRLECHCEEDSTLSSNTIRWVSPITGASDSWAIARAVTEINGAEIVAVDHDDQHIYVHVAD